MTICFPQYRDGPVRLERPAVDQRRAPRVAIRRASKQKRKLLSRIQRAVDAGESQKASGLQRLLLKSYSARLCAVAAVNPKLKSAERALSTEIVAIAERISPFQPSNEEVRLVAADKPNGGWRPITIFGLERAALQKLVCWALRPFHTADPRQFAITGGGHNEAARYVRQALADGHTWFVGLDISSFYSSIERTKINELIHLPDRVIDNVVGSTTVSSALISRAGRALAGIRLVQASQSGISQGSRSSPLIAEIIIKDILAQFPLDGRIVNVADDFGVLARSKREAVAIQMALTRATSRSPAGRFQLRFKAHSGPRRACDGFEFLGYHFQKRREVHCHPSGSNIETFNQRILGYCGQIEQGRPDAIPKMRRYIKQWWNSFPLLSEHLCDPTFAFGRAHTSRVAHAHRPQLATLMAVALAWDDTDFAALPSFIELAERARAIRRSNPVHRSQVPHWQ